MKLLALIFAALNLSACITIHVDPVARADSASVNLLPVSTIYTPQSLFAPSKVKRSERRPEALLGPQCLPLASPSPNLLQIWCQ